MLINVGVPVYEGYGLTEASPVLAVNFLGNRKVGTVGKPFPGVEVRIGPDGEILARGPNIMRCYHSEPAATAEVLDSDGWLHTGDLGSIDEEGYLVIEGRKKELFKKSTGEYVPPGPIEEALGRVPWVDTAVVIADGRTCAVALLFPDPAKLLELREAAGMADLDERQFLQSSWLRERAQQEIDRINAHLHHAERVERFAIMDHPAGVETGELTPTLKRRRFAIERQYAATIEDLYRTVGGWK
jgi:long-chain acyl-CoA synthetase